MKTKTLLPLVSLLALASLPALAKPYRMMVTRTTETVRTTNLEGQLRYQGFFHTDFDQSSPYHQLNLGLRFGLLDNLELNAGLELLALGMPGLTPLQFGFGDIPVGLQWTVFETTPFAIGLYGRGTLPTGPSNIDFINPALSDGTWDWEATLIAELRPSRELRFMLNAGWLGHGVRDREGNPFDVPDALQAQAAVAYNLDRLTLIGLEVLGRFYMAPRITPVWNDNANQVEIMPVLRREMWPGLVLEAVAGISVTPDLWNMYQFRALLGATYEFDLAKGPDLPSRKQLEDHNRKKRPAKKR